MQTHSPTSDSLGAQPGDLHRTRIMLTTAERSTVVEAWLKSTDAQTTEEAYRRDWRLFAEWCDGHDFDPFNPGRVGIDSYRQVLLRTRARATVARRLASLSSFYRYAGMEHAELVPSNPVTLVRRPRVSKESTRSGLDATEAKRVLELVTAAGGRDAAVVTLLTWTGLRVSELRHARVTDMSTERGERVLTVTRKGGKRQTVMVHRDAAAALDVYLSGRTTGPLIMGSRGGAISRHEVAVTLDRYTQLAGVGKRITPHSMRHSYATLALDAGADARDVQRAMGHESIETTMRYDRSRARVDRSPAHALSRLLA